VSLSVLRIINLFLFCLIFGVTSYVCLGQSVTLKGRVRTRTLYTPQKLKVVLIDKDSTREAKVDRRDGQFFIEGVSEGTYQVAACAGTDFIPQIQESIKVEGGKAPWIEIKLPFATNRQTVSGPTEKGNGAVVLALAYKCEVDRTQVKDNAYAFNDLPKPPAQYQIGTPDKSHRLITTKLLDFGPNSGKSTIPLRFDSDQSGAVIALNAGPFTTDPIIAGQLTGRVVDPNGASAVGAIIVLTDRDTGQSRMITTNEDGAYSTTVPVGTYEVRVEALGFHVQRQEDVSVSTNQTTNLDLTLDVADVRMTVSVVDNTNVDVTQTNLGTQFESSEIKELPIPGREIFSIALAAPGVSTLGNEEKRPLSINGSSPNNLSFLVDGAEVNRGDATTSTSIQQAPELPLDSLREVTVSLDEQKELGRESSRSINLVTKHGTNDVRGSAFYLNQNSKLAARDFFEIDKSHFHSHQFGFTIGGPIRMDQLHYFGAYEGTREVQARPRLLSVPSPERLASARSILAANGLMENGLSNRLLTFFPEPDRTGIFSNRTSNSAAVNDADNLLFRLDRTIEKGSIAIAYSFARTDRLFPFRTSFNPGFRTDFSGRTQSLSGTFVNIITSSFLSEILVRYDRNRETFLPEDHDFDPLTIGLNTGVTDPQRFGLPFIKVVGFDALGSPVELPSRQLGSSWLIRDSLALISGPHSLRFGGDVRRVSLNSNNDAGTRGRIVFDGSVLGDPLADFLAGFPAGNTGISRGDTHRQTAINAFGWFIQDELRPTRNLTLNLGLRYGYNGAPKEESDQLSSFIPEAGGLVQVGTSQLPRLYKKDLNNFAPRISIAWDLTGSGKTAIRTSWGIYFDRPSLRLFSGLCPCSNSTNAGVTMNPVGFRPVSAITPSRPIPFGIGTPIFDGPSLVDVSAVDQKLRNPYVQTFYFGIHRAITSNTVLETSYSGSVGTHLYRTIDINQPAPGDPLTRDSRRPFFSQFPQFGAINLLTSSGKSNYHALRVSVQRQLSKGLWFNGGYDFSKSIDELGPGELPQDSRNARAERALSNFEQRHRFVLTWIYEFPSSKYEVFKGWKTAGTLRLTSGNPFTPLISFDNSGTSTFLDRPNVLGDPRSHLSRTELYSAGAFEIPPRGSFGNAGRNSLTGPGLNNLDISISKRFQLTDERYIELRTDVFNLFNHPNFRLPNNLLDEPAFGNIVATDPTYARRKFQIGIRLMF
jgi:carboxypeptidase family protein